MSRSETASRQMTPYLWGGHSCPPMEPYLWGGHSCPPMEPEEFAGRSARATYPSSSSKSLEIRSSEAQNS